MSLSTQSDKALLPTLAHTKTEAIERVQKDVGTTIDKLMAMYDARAGTWLNLHLSTSEDDQQVCSAFQSNLSTTTKKAIEERFLNELVLVAVGLFDHRS